MVEWLAQFSNPNFMPHGHCYFWRSDILWTHVLSDIAIGISYYIIPIILGVLLIKRKEPMPHKDVMGLFIAFIFFCGTTHFVNIYVTWFPAYEYQGWIKALTAFTSVLTVMVLAPKLPTILNLNSLEKEFQNTKEELKQLKRKSTEMASIHASTLNREERILALKAEVNSLLKEMKKPQKYNSLAQ